MKIMCFIAIEGFKHIKFSQNFRNILLFLFMYESYYLHLMESRGEILDGGITNNIYLCYFRNIKP